MNRFKRFPVLFLSAVITLTAWSQTKTINILAVNDMHAAIDRFPRFVAFVDSMRTVYPDLLLVSGGDNRSGNPANDIHPQSSFPMMTLMNRAGFDLSVVGNHEFDGGVGGLRDVINGSEFKFVCANMFAPDSMRLHIQPYRILEVGDVRIGILGLLQLGTIGVPDTHPDHVQNIRFRPWEQVAEQYSWLRDQCDIFALLVHAEYEECVAFLQTYPYADVLIGSHTHKRIERTELHNGVMITQADASLKCVTHITFELTDGKVTKKEARLIDLAGFSGSNAEVQAMVDEFNNNESLKRVLTQVLNDLSTYEELGCLMTDAIRIETGADIAIQNPGGVRYDTFPKGPMTVRDVYQLDPFNNEILEFQLTGEEILRLIEAAYIAEQNNPPYVSGIRYEMETDRQGKVRNIQITLDSGVRLNPQGRYRVVMNSYIGTVAKFERADPGKGLRLGTTDTTIEYLEKQPAIDYKGVTRLSIKK
jgi:5'-nucleotidase